MAEIRIGMSGWQFDEWRGTLYPKGVTQKRELEYASRQFNSIELNGSFYSLQSVSSWKRWYDETPSDFVFSVKGSKFITHIRRLKEADAAVATFFAQGVLALKEKLGPILWQLPQNFKFDPERLEQFFTLLPRDTKSIAKLASKCDLKMEGRTYVEIDQNRPIRHAIEVRHESFNTPAFVKLARKHDVGIVIADTANEWPAMDEVTSDFVYARLHGHEAHYPNGYTPAALDAWAKRVKAWRKKKLDVYVYFDVDLKVRSPFDAIGLSQRVGGFVPEKVPVDPPTKMPKNARLHWPILPE